MITLHAVASICGAHVWPFGRAPREEAMRLPRREFLQLAAAAAVLPATSHIARALTYPTRPVRIIVGFPPGGATDTTARLIGQWLSERLGQHFIIENRPGAVGNIATEAVVRAPADGYTLLMVLPANATSATFYEKLSFNFIRDIAPVAGVMRVPQVMVVNPSVPATTIPEFITYAQANPGKVSFASVGIGGSIHLSGELFKMMAGVELVHVPYRGSAPALMGLIGGQVHVMFDNVSSSIEHIRGGKLRPLAVTTASRSEILPAVPALAEFIAGYESSVWFGVGAPKHTPTEIVDKLNREIDLGLADPKMKERVADLGGTVLTGSPAEFGKLIADETEKWGKLIRAANIKPE
jgi:tripartite-type tricarboxylate transporter receptor subunit TctC